jgi:MYXO-CTERM domain-containing protein
MSSRSIFALGLVSALLGASGSFSHAVSVFDDFSINSVANYVNATGRASFTYGGLDAGVGGVNGRLNAQFQTGGANDGNNAFALNSSVGTFDLDGPFTVSIYFLTGLVTPAGTANMNIASVGLGDNATSVLASSSPVAPNATLQVDLRRVNPANTFSLRLRANDAGGDISPGSISLAENTWYQLSLTATQISVGNFSLQASVRNWGADGLTGGSTILSHSANLANANLLGNEAIFAGFAARNSGNSDTRAVAVDNFVVVPEPSAALAGIFGLGLLALRRRR